MRGGAGRPGRSRIALVVGLLLLLAVAGCSTIAAIVAPVAQWGSADLTTYVAMGTSISAGKQSDGLVERHQRKSFAYLFAQQAGTAFAIPSFDADGLPAVLKLLSLSPLFISRSQSTPGSPTNANHPTAYNNMGIPGALLADVADSSLYTVPGRDTTLKLIQRSRGTVLQQVAGLSPTFITFEYGSNEILGAAGQGSGTPLLSVAQFGGLLTLTLNGLQAAAPNAKVVMVNVPDVPNIPFFTTFPPFVVDANGNPVFNGGQLVTLIGPGGQPLAPNDFVLLSASTALANGDGFPVGTFSYVSGAPGNGNPLPDALILSAAETAQIQAAIDGYDAAIASEAQARGFPLVDLRAIFQQVAANGYEFQGTTYTSDFVTGGLFSLDGVHPTDLAHGIVCNALIDVVNAAFGAAIPHLNLASVASPTSSSLRRARGEGPSYPRIEDAERIAPGFGLQGLPPVF